MTAVHHKIMKVLELEDRGEHLVLPKVDRVYFASRDEC